MWIEALSERMEHSQCTVLGVTYDLGISGFEMTSICSCHVVFGLDTLNFGSVIELFVGAKPFIDDGCFAEFLSGNPMDSVGASLVLQDRSAGEELLAFVGSFSRLPRRTPPLCSTMRSIEIIGTSQRPCPTPQAESVSRSFLIEIVIDRPFEP